MGPVFADTQFWVAPANPRDPRASRAQQAARSLSGTTIVTTDEVLVEFLGFLSKAGVPLRIKAAELCRAILSDRDVAVVAQSRESLLAGLELYEARPDKAYSLVDCISMTVMRSQDITEALTADGHFVQEGFVALLA